MRCRAAARAVSGAAKTLFALRQRWWLTIAVIGCAPAAALADDWGMGASNSKIPPSVFGPVSTPAHEIDTVAIFVISITAAIILIVAGLLAYSIVRFRTPRRATTAANRRRCTAAIRSSSPGPRSRVLIVLVLILTTARTIYTVQAATRPPGAINVRVIAHQWWWEFRYPDLDIVTANEIHVPVSDRAQSDADLSRSGVRRRRAQLLGAAPGGQDRPDPEPEEHDVDRSARARNLPGAMRRVLRHGARPDAAAGDRRAARANSISGWRRSAAAGGRRVGAAHGRQIFESTACVNCHTVRGTAADGRFGPDLTHLMSRETLGSGRRHEYTRSSCDIWVRDPNVIKPGALMPAMNLGDKDLTISSRYLATCAERRRAAWRAASNRKSRWAQWTTCGSLPVAGQAA